MSLIEDRNADRRSLMYRAPCICDGEKTGIRCKHYWSLSQKFRAANADTLRDGEKQRACTLTDGLVLEFTTEEKPTRCNRYTPEKEPGLVALVRRAIALATFQRIGPGYVKFDAEFEAYKPMTLEEIAELRRLIPDDPALMNKRGKSPDQMTVDDIMNGEQIGILKPGEAPPSSELSKETEAALDGIFGSSGGIFDNKK